MRCVDIEQLNDFRVKVTYNVHIGIQNISPATCQQLDSCSIRIGAEHHNISVPLRFTKFGLFKDENHLHTSISGTESNIQNICTTLGYNHFTAEVVDLPRGQKTIEINSDMKTYMKNQNKEGQKGFLSLECSRKGSSSVFCYLMCIGIIYIDICSLVKIY